MNRKEFDKLLNIEMATASDHRKAGAFKASQFWLNQVQDKLSQKEFAELAQYSLVARYRQTNSYDQVSRNPGEFATDASNRYLESLGFPPKEFYELMKNPEQNQEAINQILGNIPDKIIEMFAPWYDDFMNNDSDTSLNNKDGNKTPEKFQALKQKQFLALAAFGAITWGTNSAIEDSTEAQKVKSNIIQYKKNHPEAFQPIIDKLESARITHGSKLAEDPPEFSNVIQDLFNNEDLKKTKDEIQTFNDPYANQLEILKDRFYALGNDRKNQYGLDGKTKEKCLKISEDLRELYDKIVAERTTGEKLSHPLIEELQGYMIDNIILDSKINTIKDTQKDKALNAYKELIHQSPQYHQGQLSQAIKEGNASGAKQLIQLGVPFDMHDRTSDYKRSFFNRVADVFRTGSLKAFNTPPKRSLADIGNLIGIKTKKPKSKTSEETQMESLSSVDQTLTDRLSSLQIQDETPQVKEDFKLSDTSPSTVITHSFSDKKSPQKDNVQHAQAYEALLTARLEEIEKHPEYNGEPTPSQISLKKESEALKDIKSALGKSQSDLQEKISEHIKTLSSNEHGYVNQGHAPPETMTLLRSMKDGIAPDVDQKSAKGLKR